MSCCCKKRYCWPTVVNINTSLTIEIGGLTPTPELFSLSILSLKETISYDMNYHL